MMITATQAKKLYDESGKEIQDYLKSHIEPAVIKAAKAGERNAFVLIDSLGPYEYVDQKITPLGKGVLAELEKLGYSAKIEKEGELYIPRGLADDDGNGPIYTNYGFHIGW